MKNILISFTLVLFSSLYAYADINEGLIAYFPFDGNAGAGTVYGATLTTDRFGNPDSAYSFDGNDYIDYGKGYAAGSTEITISLWVKNSYTNTQNEPIIRKWLTSDGGWGSYCIWGGGSSLIACTVQNYTLHQYPTWIASSIPIDNQWHHIVFSYKKKDPVNHPNDDAKIFIDGIRCSTTFANDYESNFSIEYSVGQVEHNLYFARKVSAFPNDYYHGGIDDIRIYNRQLSDAEIQELYNPPSTSTTSIADTDGDGIPDNIDNCLTVCNPLQKDADNDQIGDLCDPSSGCGGCGSPACEQACTTTTTTL